MRASAAPHLNGNAAELGAQQQALQDARLRLGQVRAIAEAGKRVVQRPALAEARVEPDLLVLHRIDGRPQRIAVLHSLRSADAAPLTLESWHHATLFK